MKPDSWMPLYIADYLADTQHLTRDEHGAYLLLLMAYWRNGGPLQDDDKRLASIVKATAREWASLRATLAEFFAVEDGLWIHKRVDEERAKAAKFIDKQKANGNKGGRPRKTQTITQKEPMGFAWDNPDHNPNESPSPSQLKPSPELFAQDPNISTDISKPLETKPPKQKVSTAGKGRAQKLPDDFSPSEEHWRLASELGVDLRREIMQFRDYHSARGTTMVSWPAALRTWLRNAPKFRAQGPPMNGKQAARDSYAAQAAQAREQEHERPIERDITGDAERIA